MLIPRNFLFASNLFGDSYRLGALGFLSSQELLSAGIKSNNGLRDQRTALTWIRKYIDGFGGEPNNITAVGVSTGSSETPKNIWN
jgi:carboxylesterase type B